MWAAERRTSVSAMVRKLLVAVAAEETPFERLRREEGELRNRLRRRGVTFAASDRLSRDALHDRHAFRCDLNAGQVFDGLTVVNPFARP